MNPQRKYGFRYPSLIFYNELVLFLSASSCFCSLSQMGAILSTWILFGVEESILTSVPLLTFPKKGRAYLT